MIWNIRKSNSLLTEESDKIRNMRYAGLTPEIMPPNLRSEPMDPKNMSLDQQLFYGTYRGGSNWQPDGSNSLVVPKAYKPATSFDVVAPYQKRR